MKARGEHWIIGAILVSIIVHIALMAWVRTRIMTHVERNFSDRTRRAPMQFSKTAELQRPTSLDELLDLKPLREAPAAEMTKPAPVNENLVNPAAPKVAPELPPSVEHKFDPVEPKFELPTPKFAEAKSAPKILTHLETPSAAKVALTLGASTVPAATVSTPAPQLPMANFKIAANTVRKERMASLAPTVPFIPRNEVFSEVDTQSVEAEKAAVRALVNAEHAEELANLVSVSAKRCLMPDGCYFELIVQPRPALKVIPKDIVVILDASGSIGADRMGSIRKAAKRILRSATNTGDRFNLVAFRDRYTYAFRAWQDCTQGAFDASDRWLNNVAAHGRTDVFSTIESILTLPRHPSRPLIALVVTDGDANVGVSDTPEIISRFTELNDGLVSVYMYGVKSAANRELMDGLTHGNRGESLVFEGWRWNAGEGIEPLSERFRDPVLSDLRLIFASEQAAEVFPRRLRNLYRDDKLTILGKVRPGVRELKFSLKGLNGSKSFESYFNIPLTQMSLDANLPQRFKAERHLDFKYRKEK